MAKNDQAEKEYSKAKSGSGRYQDRNFLLSDKVRNYGNDADQIFHVGDKTFIDGVDTDGSRFPCDLDLFSATIIVQRSMYDRDYGKIKSVNPGLRYCTR